MTDPKPQEAAQTLAEQYELGDESQNVTDEMLVATPEATPVPSAERPTPQRDPETGQFLPKKTEHTKRLLRRAADVGLDQEEIDGTGSEQLENLVFHLERRALADARLESRARATHPDRSLASDQTASTTDEGTTTAGQAPTDDDFGLPADQYDPELVKLLRKQHDRIKALEQQLEGVTTHVKRREQESFATHVDRLFAELGPAYETVFGKGNVGKLKKDTPTMQARLDVLQAVEMQKSRPGTFEEKFERAVQILFGDQAAKPAPAKAAPEEDVVKRWNDAALVRPTHRAGAKEPEGRTKAIKAAAAYIEENGLADRPGVDDFPE